jgi:hypothetical protein
MGPYRTSIVIEETQDSLLNKIICKLNLLPLNGWKKDFADILHNVIEQDGPGEEFLKIIVSDRYISINGRVFSKMDDRNIRELTLLYDKIMLYIGSIIENEKMLELKKALRGLGG